MQRFALRFATAAAILLSATFASAGDREMANEIAKGLRNSGKLRNYRLGVKFKDGTAVLSGHVTGKSQRATAIALVKRMPGVDKVVSRLGVRPGSSTVHASYQGTAGETATIRRMVEMKQAAQTPAPQPFGGSGVAMAAPLPIASTAGNVPLAAYVPGAPQQVAPARYDQPHLPAYAWPSYAPYPNYAAVTYPKQYSPTAWPYIGPFYPYPQVPLGWRKVTLEWDDGWWWLDFKD